MTPALEDTLVAVASSYLVCEARESQGLLFHVLTEGRQLQPQLTDYPRLYNPNQARLMV